MTTTAPTCEQLFNEELPLADRKTDDSWRHVRFWAERLKH